MRVTISFHAELAELPPAARDRLKQKLPELLGEVTGLHPGNITVRDLCCVFHGRDYGSEHETEGAVQR